MEPSSNAMGKEEACSLAMSIATGSVPFMVLKAVIELDVLEIIKRAGSGAQLSPAQITAQLPSKNPVATTSMLDRILRVLASHSILSFSLREEEDARVERLYGLAPPSEFFTKDENGGGLASVSLFIHDKTFMESWYHLKDAVLDGGIPFSKAYGMSAFEYLGKDARFNDAFNNAMADYAPITMNKLLDNYKGFQGLSTLVDVGGNTGTTLNAIISKHPTIKGINFDLPHVIKDAPIYNGIEHFVGDMFVSVPKGDAIFIKRILHDWSDEHCIRLLKNCYAALPDHGKVIACEYILPVAPETSHAAKMVFQLDAVMLAYYIGGKERTELEFEALAKEAGFKAFRLASSAYDMKVMEFLKNQK